MNRRELINEIAKSSGLKHYEVKKLFSAFSESVTESLARGEKVTISGFGSFIPSKRRARIGINPHTKEKINIPATTTAYFKPSKIFKEKFS